MGDETLRNVLFLMGMLALSCKGRFGGVIAIIGSAVEATRAGFVAVGFVDGRCRLDVEPGRPFSTPWFKSTRTTSASATRATEPGGRAAWTWAR
jgi:hypothetical protein